MVQETKNKRYVYLASIYGAPALFQFQFMVSQAYSRHGITGHGSSWGRGGCARGLLGTGLLFGGVWGYPAGGGLLSFGEQVFVLLLPRKSTPGIAPKHHYQNITRASSYHHQN